MTKIPNLKYYAPAAGIVALGLVLLLGGAVRTQANSKPVPPPTVRAKLIEATVADADAAGNVNTLEGKVTINKSTPVPKGVLMVFEQDKPFEASTFGDIAPDGHFHISHVPLGKVSVVLRPDTETVLDLLGMPKDGKLKIKAKRRGPSMQDLAEGKYDFSSAKPIETAFTAFLKALPEEKRYLLMGAFFKYGKLQNENTIKTSISEGFNRINIDLIVP